MLSVARHSRQRSAPGRAPMARAIYVLPVREDDAEVEVHLPHVWVFHGEGARFASGVFNDRDTALQWAELHRLTGIIAEYPLGVGCYDLAVTEGLFRPS